MVLKSTSMAGNMCSNEVPGGVNEMLRTLVLVTLISAACSQTAWACDAERWVSYPPKELWNATPLSPDRYVILPDVLKDRAVARLSSASFYELAADEMRAAGIQQDASRSRLKPYVVRAIRYNIRGGGWTIRRIGQQLDVSYTVLTKQPIELLCEPVIVFLEEAPTAVFSHAHAAE
jgi:hypothetical protein